MCEVSVAIACYNVEKYIEQCLLSILNQDFEDLEILVCDDCSSDKSLDIVKRVCMQHPKGYIVRIIQGEHNQGTAAIRNMGIDNAKGKYLLFLDGDDYISENAISILYNRMLETHANLVIGNHTVFIDEIKLNNKNSTNHTTGYISDVINCRFAIAEWMKRRKSEYYPVALWNKLFDKSFLLRNNIRCDTSHSIIDDIYFAYQTMVKANNVAIIDDVTMFWRHRNGSAMHIDVREDRLKIYVRVFDRILNDIIQLKENNNGKVLPVQLYYTLTNRYVSGFIINNILSSRLLSRKQKKEYLSHVSVITRIGLKRSDFISRFSKVCFTCLSSTYRFYLLKLVFVIKDMVR